MTQPHGSRGDGPVIGCNWLPSWGSNPHDAWGEYFRPELAARELGFAAALGFTSVRVWLSPQAWEDGSTAFTTRLGTVLDLATENALTVLPVVFDGCGVESERGELVPLGHQITSLRLKLAGSTDELVRNAIDAAWRDRPHPADVDHLIPVPSTAHAGVVIWKSWTPSPPRLRLDDADRTTWAAYLADVVDAVGGHPALAGVDIFNEPYSSLYGAPPEPTNDFLRWAATELRHRLPGVPLVMGAENSEQHDQLEIACGQPLDSRSLHSYSASATELGRVDQEVPLLGG